MAPERYMYEGKLEIDTTCKIGYVIKFTKLDSTKETTVSEYIGEQFIRVQDEITSICTEMETSSEMGYVLIIEDKTIRKMNKIRKQLK